MTARSASLGAQLLGIERVRRLYRQLPSGLPPAEFARLGLESLGVTFATGHLDVEQIPPAGSVVLVANHPFGAIEGLFLIWLAWRRRPDVRVVANDWLGELAAIADLILPIDPFGRSRSVSSNALSLRRALRWTERGGALIVFPAGEVSHFQPAHGCVMDPDWSPTMARLIRKTGAPVVPVHFSGHNSAAFQLAGLVHERMRTALLAHEMFNKRGRQVQVRIGLPITASRIGAMTDDNALASYLRMRTYALADTPPIAAHSAAQARPLAVATAQPAADLERELDGLDPGARLVAAQDMSVYCAAGSRIPRLLQEIGRLRELTFRAAGAGTGRALDIDLFDNYYDHLFLWSHPLRRVVGAYRLGRADRIVARFGERGLYTSTQFGFRLGFISSLGTALELGRSFVRVEHQREYGAMHLLWKGIGEYVRRDLRYHKLFGAVSIGNDYGRVSQASLVEFLRRRHGDSRRARFVRSLHPVSAPATLRPLFASLARCRNVDEVSALIADLEPDGKGVPVLIRNYLRLGGRILGFNRDPGFSDSIDCLLLMDLKDTEPHLLQRYVGSDGVAAIQGRQPITVRQLARRA